jgi:hypothetical protein
LNPSIGVERVDEKDSFPDFNKGKKRHIFISIVRKVAESVLLILLDMNSLADGGNIGCLRDDLAKLKLIYDG